MVIDSDVNLSCRPFLSRAEALANGVAATRRLLQLKRQHAWSVSEYVFLVSYMP